MDGICRLVQNPVLKPSKIFEVIEEQPALASCPDVAAAEGPGGLRGPSGEGKSRVSTIWIFLS